MGVLETKKITKKIELEKIAQEEQVQDQQKEDDVKELDWDDVNHVDVIGLEIGYRLIPLVDKAQGGELLSRIKGVRKKLSQEFGFLVPAVHSRDNLDLDPNAYQISLMGVTIGSAEIRHDQELAINPGQVFGKLDGVATKDPAFGLDAVWITQTQREQAQALEDLQNLGFKVGIENSADASVPAGSVIRTQPPSNTVINPDSLVTIIVSVGPEAFPIPYVLDIETERAIYVVEESGFTLGQLLEVNDENIPRGFVISQNPVAGTKMSPDSTVDLVISAGPSLIEISDLSRKSIVDAIQILETLGFEYEFIEEYSEDVSVGLVSHTIPRAGELVTIDQVIQVIVSIGLKVEVPNLIGFTYQEASNILQEIGLLPSASGDTGGRVSEQNPREGEFIDPEGFVELSFGS